jgi:hypothetical protein
VSPPPAGPGHPFQVLGFTHANPAGFPLLSLTRPEKKNHREVEDGQGRRSKKKKTKKLKNKNFFNFFDLAVKISLASWFFSVSPPLFRTAKMEYP